MRQRAFTLVEVLIYGIILMVASTTVIVALISLGKTQTQATAYPTAQSQAQDAIGAVAAYLRRAPLCDTTQGCTGVADSAFSTAGANTMTLYTSATGSTATFSTVNGALVRTQNGSSATIVPDSLTMKYEYMTSQDKSYTFTATSESYTWQSSVSTSSLPQVAAVRITATIVRDGLTTVQTSVVRLRNSPKKTFGTS